MIQLRTTKPYLFICLRLAMRTNYRLVWYLHKELTHTVFCPIW